MSTMEVSDKPQGASLSYIEVPATSEKAKGYPLLFIHGAESSKETWKSVIEDLKGNYRIFAIDLRGHGNTPLGNIEQFILENLVEDIHSFVTENRLNNLILIAHSMGTRIATCYVAKYPETVKAYVLEDMEMLPRKKEVLSNLDYLKLIAFTPLQPTILKVYEEMEKFGYSQGKVDSWFRQGRITKTDTGTYQIGVNPLVTHLAKNVISASIKPQEAFKAFSEREIPVMLLKAEKESCVSVKGLKEMRKNLPNLIVQEIPNSLHSIHKSATKPFLNAIIPFFEKVSFPAISKCHSIKKKKGAGVCDSRDFEHLAVQVELSTKRLASDSNFRSLRAATASLETVP